MSAQDNLSQELFHGTGAVLKPGDVIQPRQHEVAYSTIDPGYAKHYANEANYRPTHLQRDKDEKEIKHWQMPLFSMVYHVEPVDHQEMHDTTEHYNKHVWESEESDIKVSKKGFRVKGVHSYVPKDKFRI